MPILYVHVRVRCGANADVIFISLLLSKTEINHLWRSQTPQPTPVVVILFTQCHGCRLFEVVFASYVSLCCLVTLAILRRPFVKHAALDPFYARTLSFPRSFSFSIFSPKSLMGHVVGGSQPTLLSLNRRWWLACHMVENLPPHDTHTHIRTTCSSCLLRHCTDRQTHRQTDWLTDERVTYRSSWRSKFQVALLENEYFFLCSVHPLDREREREISPLLHVMLRRTHWIGVN